LRAAADRLMGKGEAPKKRSPFFGLLASRT
jgi:hypothetical protein